MPVLRRRERPVAPQSDDQPPTGDERLSLLLEQARRGIVQQQHDLDNLRSRAGTFVAAAALATSFLGAATLRDSDLPAPALASTVVALGALVVILAAASYILLPYEWKWGIDAWSLLRDYIEPVDGQPASLDEMRRSLASYMQQDANHNAVRLGRLFTALRVAAVPRGD